ncbi:MAG: DNA mismatch repair endonuclease MutL, partial [Clostridia bacterium]|nr:DNA mismatch repair endonuclease MutL [Clostridia bacterium]
MGKINVLSFEVANLIAAGEVVDRPASVIKELVENSIDAGADRVTVEIQRGGVLFMRVTDNGSGIEPEDLPIAVRRHATSKIREADDLEAIMTLGFRGEALAAICSVADVRIISKTRDREMGAFIEINSGRVGAVSERGASDGTTIIVENLFANVPARLKFLKRDLTEGMAVCAVLEKIALSHPEVAFKLIADGSLKLETSGDGNRQSVIRSVYGKDFAKAVLEVNAERDGVKVSGFITSPATPRANRNYQNFFINGRYIKTKTGMAAIEQAYTSYIPPEKFPGCVIYIDIAPNTVDVNVHPGKLEVKFSNERPVFDAIYHATRTALAENTERPEINSLEGRKPAFTSSTKPSANFAFVPVVDRTLDKTPQFSQMDISEPPKPAEEKPPLPEAPPPEIPVFRAPPVYKSVVNQIVEEPKKEYILEPLPTVEPKREEFAKPAEPVEGGFYRLVGEVFNSYIIVENKNVMMLVDKHAAHERLIFESLKRALTSLERDTQLMAVPVEVMLMSEEIASLEEYREKIERVGFGFRSARNTVYVTEIPSAISVNAVSAIFESFAEAIRNGSGVELTTDIIFEKALYQASCKAAIKAGRVYPEGYAEWLVRELRANPEVICCPHGRPIAIEITKNTIDHLFKRS